MYFKITANVNNQEQFDIYKKINEIDYIYLSNSRKRNKIKEIEEHQKN